MDKLRKERELRGWSCQVASKRVGISKPFYWQIENEQRNLTYAMAIKIAHAFQMTPDELLYEDEVKRLKRERRL